ncbi:MAG TPA: hypothetical protein VK912_02295 [Longimicrobiales bacterium]|nr:hypothetical protein [Longimicrobiales bacterium]
MEPISVTGEVVDSATRQGIPGLRVEAWEKDGAPSALVGNATTDRVGRFVINVEEAQLAARRAALFFRILRGAELITSTEDTVVWTPGSSTEPVRVEVTLNPQPEPPSWTTLHVNSFDELIAHEQEILGRIAATPNGGKLFLTHPFMLLADLGVELSKRAERELIAHEPVLGALSPVSYNHLKASTRPQSVKVNLRGLFQRRAQ